MHKETKTSRTLLVKRNMPLLKKTQRILSGTKANQATRDSLLKSTLSWLNYSTTMILATWTETSNKKK